MGVGLPWLESGREEHLVGLLDFFGDWCVGEEIFPFGAVAVFVVSQPLYFAQEKFYVMV